MGFWDAIGALGNWVEEHLRDILNIIGSVLESLVVAFRAVMGTLGQVLTGHFHIFTSLAKWISHALGSLVKKWIPGLIAEIRSLYAKLRAWAKPVIDAIHKIRQLQQLYFDDYIKPILNFLQHLRQGLLILRLLHVKFAAALDARLVDLEDKLTARFLEVLRTLNTLTSYMNYILDPFGLVNSGLYLQTALRSIHGLIAAEHDAQMGLTGAADLAFGKKYSNPFTPDQVHARTATAAAGRLSQDDLDNWNVIRDNLSKAGYDTSSWAAS